MSRKAMDAFETAAAAPSTLPTVSLGRTGKQITRYGLGGFHQLEITSEIVEQVVDAYLAEGGNYIETARSYGNGASEAKIGRALRGRRSRVILASKTAAATADEARRDVERSLETLGTDHIEFYFLHGVDADKLEQVAGKGGAAEGLLKAKAEGLIDGVGLSSHTPPTYLEAFERIPLDLILIWYNYLDNLNFPIIPERIVPEARRRGIGVTAMKPVADGFLYRSAEAAIRYALGAGAEVAIVGTNSVEQVRQAAAAVRKGEMDQAGREAVLRDAVELGQYVCRRCGQCPRELMETFRLEGEFDRQMIDGFPHGPAENALRKVLSRWFGLQQAAREAFAAAGWDPDRLLAAAGRLQCPYGIDVPRKAGLALAKLTRGEPQRL